MAGKTHRYLRYKLGRIDTSEQTDYIDLAKDLSLVNQRLFRQGREYFVKRITFLSTNTPGGYVEVNTAPCTWSTYTAYRKAKRLWNKMNKQALQDAALPSSVKPKYHDFKINLNNSMRSLGTLVPRDGGSVQSQTADSEWIYSKFISTDANQNDEFTSHLMGDDVGSAPNFTSVGIIKGYEDTRILPSLADPLLPTYIENSWMSNLFDNEASADDIIENLDSDNDRPPYDATDLTGASNLTNPHTVQMVALGPNDTMPRMGGFCVPFGLLEIVHQSEDETDNIDMLIELAPGSYHGVKSMGI